MPETESSTTSPDSLVFRLCPDCSGRVEYHEHGAVFCPECDETFQHVTDEVGGVSRHRLNHREGGEIQEVRV